MYLGPGLKSGVMGGRGRGGKKPFVSPAKAIWGADFELHGDDCPLGPGVWKDRIGGLEATCVGDGDWWRNERRCVGVTKSDVCYATFGADIAAKITTRFFTTTRTVAIIWERDQVAATPRTQSPIFWTKWNGDTAGDPVIAYYLNPSGGYRAGAYVSGTASAFASPLDADGYRLVATAKYKRPGMGTNNITRLTYSVGLWVWNDAAIGTTAAAGDFSSGQIFRKYGIGIYSDVANTTVRHLGIRSIAAGPERPDIATLAQWAAAEGASGAWVNP